MKQYILSLDQGTTSSRAILFDHDGQIVATQQQEFPQILPAPGVVEHNPENIWSTQLDVARGVLEQQSLGSKDVAAIGVTNQRETTILWERDTGKVIANAIVWQSRISTDICAELKQRGLEPLVQQKTGLLLDPYFSGTKIKYLLDTHEGLRRRAANGEILFGTIDSFLIWRLTGGSRHVTDVSNASRTLLYNIHSLDWDDELLKELDIPRAMMPEVCGSSEVYGETCETCFDGPIPIAGCAGDQQAAAFGQICFEPGSVKNTYGTGCFMLLNTGDSPKASSHKLLSTIGWKMGDQVTYFLEGSVFIGGAVVQWLRDGLGIIKSAAEVEKLAAEVPDSGGVVLVPAFVGLGAPHWDPYARGTMLGITRGTKAAHVARAALDSMALQTRDVLEAMQKDSGVTITELKVDGGAAANNGLLQFQADILDAKVSRPAVAETTALGAAFLAGLAVGYWTDLEDVAKCWKLDRVFQPSMRDEIREKSYNDWQRAVQRSLNWAAGENEGG